MENLRKEELQEINGGGNLAKWVSDCLGFAFTVMGDYYQHATPSELVMNSM